jgi:hypothetical protein
MVWYTCQKLTDYVNRFATLLISVLLLSAGILLASEIPPNVPFPKGLPRKRILWVSETGDDSTAVKGERSKAWRTAYDIYDAEKGIYHGAVTVAQPGDWIVFEPGTYHAPSIPLNFPGNGTGRGINLFVPTGATIIRTNFSNTNATILPAGLIFCGPLVIPGNRSRVNIEGTVIATNNATFDAVFGWADFLSGYDLSSGGYYGFTNRAATNVVLDGHGTMIGWSDVVYVSSIRSGFVASLTCRNVHLRSLWDCFYFSGRNFVQTSGLDAFATAQMASHASHGIVVVNGGQWIDRKSSFAATGTSLPGDNNAAAYVVNATNRFLGSRLVAYGNANVVPFIARGSHSAGWYLSFENSTNDGSYVILGQIGDLKSR